jgi:hypothetical protein
MKHNVIAAGLMLLFTVPVLAQTAPPTPGPEHKKLEAWIGTWTIPGVGKDSASDPGYRVDWMSEARWILGGAFVEFNHLEKYKGKEFRFLEVVGYDSVQKAYTSHIFRSNGTVESWQATFIDKTYLISGTSMANDGKQEKWRCTYVFSPDGASCTCKCETEREGAKWISFSGKGTKAKTRKP